MARIPAEEIERLRREVSIVALVEARGVALAKRGADLHGRCPFHDDKTPSLVVSPKKNLWHCLGKCQAGGGVIDWVMKTEGVSFRHAVELLREGAPLGGNRAKKGTIPKLAPPVSLDADDAALFEQVVAYYHRSLHEEPAALSYVVEKRGISRAAIDHFRLGFCNRTLGLRLPQSNRSEGAAVRARLQKLGLVRESGHEHFRGRVTIPIVDEHGAVVSMYGRVILHNLRAGTPDHLYLPGPHRGVFNLDGLRRARQVILCEALIDALTVWAAGFKNLTSSYGVEGFTDELSEALKQHQVERVLVAYDRDDAGDAAAAKLIERLRAEGFSCARILFPRGMDANSYALKVQPAEKALRLVVDKALFEGQARIPIERAAAAKEEDTSLPLAAPLPPAATPSGATPAAAPAAPGPTVEVKGDDEIAVVVGDRRYRVRGIKKNLSHEVLRVNVFAASGEEFHVDTLDLYSAKQRGVFLAAAARELGIGVEILRRDLGRVLLVVEEKNDEAMREVLEPKNDAPPEMTSAERDEATALLRDPNLVSRILADFEVCGVVGERTNKLTGYLAAVSRKLDDPLAIVVQSSSAAGKSSLMEAVLAFVPSEEKVKYSAMTGQSLFYMGDVDLKHKVLAIVEEEGAERASYALKLLQSEKELTIASTGKDPETGKLVTHEYRVEGPVMIFLTTTAIEVDEELMNRCVVLTVDEDREQTRAIHALQRRRETLSGLLAKEERSALVKLHQNAQRLLRPLHVVNPFAEKLTFLDSKTRTRRDHMKYLGLIRTIALLHQHQRVVQTVQRKGQAIEYIEATLDDVALANALCHDVLGRSLDELPPQTRKLLVLLSEMVERRCTEANIERDELRFSRRDALDATGYGLTQLRTHLERLVELELVLVHRGLRGQSFVYELLWDGGAGADHRLPGLVDVAALGGAATMERWRGVLGGLAGPWRGENGPMAGGVRPPSVDEKPANPPATHVSGGKSAASYRSRTSAPYAQATPSRAVP